MTEARCRKCKVYGGKETPCEQQGKLDNPEFRKEKWGGRRCPRVILHEENYAASEIIAMAMGEASSLASELYRLRCRHMAAHERLSVLRRVKLGVDEFTRLSREKTEKDRKAAERKAKAR